MTDVNRIINYREKLIINLIKYKGDIIIITDKNN